MVVLFQAPLVRMSADRGFQQVYVDYLEAAPWNWDLSALGIKRRFSRTGQVLMRAAIELSIELGRGGRVCLHSLPQAEDIYKFYGFELVEFDSAKQNLAYYEMSAERAKLFLKG